MISFYVNTGGEIAPGAIQDVSNSFVLDDTKKTLKVMNEYEFNFMKLDSSYQNSSTDASSYGLSLYGANLMYDDLQSQIGHSGGEEIERIESSVNLLESDLATHISNTTIHITSDERTAWADANSKKHEHQNKVILDGVSDASVAAWVKDTSYTSGTKSELDTGTDTTDKVWSPKAISDYVLGKGYTNNEGTVTSVGMTVPTGLSVSGQPISTSGTLAVSMAEGYVIPLNASLNNFQSAYEDSHSHSNKALLDDISAEDVNGWDDAASKAHKHTNSAILDGITDASVSAWDAGEPGTVTHIVAGAGLTGGTITDSGTIALAESGATSGDYGQASDASVETNGSDVTVNIPYITVDAYGRITSITTHTLKVKDLNTTYSAGALADLNAGTDETAVLWDASTISQFVTSQLSGGVRYKNDFNAETGEIEGGGTLTSVSEKKGDMYIVSTAGTFLGHELQVGDSIIFKNNVSAGTAPVESNISFVQGTVKVINKNATLVWDTSVEIADVEGVSIYVKLPAAPTKADLDLENVENKSAATILSEMTASNISTALGYIPLQDSDISDLLSDSSVNTEVTDSDAYLPTSKAVKGFVEGKGYTTNTGTVTSVGVSVPTGLSVSGTPVTESGTIEISMGTGYAIPKDASLDNFQTAYTNSHTHSNADILDGITDTSVEDWTRDTSYNDGTISQLQAGTNEEVRVWDASTIHNYVEGLGYTSNVGTVTSVGLTMPTGFEVSDSPVTVDGSIAVTMAVGYAIPQNASLDNFETAYIQSHTHSNADILNGITDASIASWEQASYPAGTEALLIDGDDETMRVWDASTIHGYIEGLGYTTNVGTVTSVGITVPTGLEVSNSPITVDGSIALTMASGYAIPLNASLDNFQIAYTNNHTHSNAAILNGITDTSVADWKRDTSYGTGTASDLTTGTGTTAKVWDASTIANYVKSKISIS